MVVWMGVYALFNFINEINLIGQHNYTTLSAIIYVVADLPAVIYAHSSVIILLGCLLGMGHLAATLIIMANIHHDKILILDFGSQYTQLIARRVREIGIYCELLPYDVDDDFIKKFNPKGVILFEHWQNRRWRNYRYWQLVEIRLAMY
jgi:hypothetical protein